MVNGGLTNVGVSLPVTTPNQSVVLSAYVAAGMAVLSAGASTPPPPTGGLVGGLLRRCWDCWA